MESRVGYLGGPGTFGHAAMGKYFIGKAISEEKCVDHYEICEKVGKGQLEFGVVALENVIDGVVAEVVRAVVDVRGESPLRIIGEVEIPVNLVCVRNVKCVGEIKRIFAFDVAKRQCRKYIKRKVGNNVMPADSTVDAAIKAIKDLESAAIASEVVLDIYKELKVVDDGKIMDNVKNFTRFWILGNIADDAQKVKVNDKYKTCIILNLDKRKDGVLCTALTFFSDEKIGLTVIYPIPQVGRKWQYHFLAEFDGNITDKAMERAIENLKESGICEGGPVILGCYPSGTGDL